MSQSQYSDVSDDEFENYENASTNITEMSVLVMMIANHKILLSNSQVPEIKGKKAKSIVVVILIEEIFKTTCKRYDR